jgi:hypothetical protein
VLTIIPLRAGNDPALATALSAMVRSGGYLIAGLGALTCGPPHSTVHTWREPFKIILLVLCGQAVTGIFVVRSTPICRSARGAPAPDVGSRSARGILRRMLRARLVWSGEVFNVRGHRVKLR